VQHLKHHPNLEETGFGTRRRVGRQRFSGAMQRSGRVQLCSSVAGHISPIGWVRLCRSRKSRSESERVSRSQRLVTSDKSSGRGEAVGRGPWAPARAEGTWRTRSPTSHPAGRMVMTTVVGVGGT
jgi:hypothetical protein